MTSIPPYIADILAQPQALNDLLENFDPSILEPLSRRLRQGEFDRILITGMGSSYSSAYPAWMHLARLPIPIMLVPTAELLHSALAQVGPRTLLWINSQSGQSGEIVRLLDAIQPAKPACTLAFVNDGASPLANRAGVVVPIRAGAEVTVSTKTYTNMLAALTLATAQLRGESLRESLEALRVAAGEMQAYLSDWEARVAEVDGLIGRVEQTLILGRGSSLAAVWVGSLINKEAARCTFEGMSAADFRHGPLELAGPSLQVLVYAGEPSTRSLNRALALEVVRYGGKAIWIAPEQDAELPTLVIPQVAEPARPLMEVLPVQMLTIAMARRKGLEPGRFRHVGKITAQE